MQQKIEKMLVFSKIFESELVSLNCLYRDEVTFHGRPMC